MKLPKNAKIEAVCSNDETRLVLTHPYLDIKDGSAHVLGCDGTMLVGIPVTVEEGEESGHVSIPSLVAARKAAPGRGPEKDFASVHCNGSCRTKDADFARPDLGTYPNWRMVVPSEEQRGALKLAFDANKLASLVKAAGGNGKVQLFAMDESSPITVKVDGALVGTIAVLMPCRL